ncbi:ATP-binding cassette domain-containing protein [[Clostridium] innocuum]|nr:ATP-binding cassette domain-containing protein [Erysipelotrichaceae bacterium]MCR0383445.1 ATP-binding cassette domain-containing protein [[Clostridium] innocuum]MCR0413660.1 ATP-binding cassette domain-containing protein [[Clostridium] innocuum]MCR0532954.1 ATP-binding cassette domain-containing protein [[Clostridium] innocuum]MCR0537013.1 ATP-binding cassette domain-containing protein [[Clostridium] innocuum]
MNVKLEQLSKRFGSVTAVQHMNAVLTPGITGLLGANGSGKTTLLRMMVNVLPPDEGQILYGDIDIQEKREEYLANIGYMPQHLGMYPTFRVEEFLQYMGAVKGLTKAYTTQRMEELLPAVHLTAQRKKKIRTLSGGMRQRLGIAQALLNDPAILILDEPTAGLDPKERNQFSQLLSELSKDKIILLSTHIVSDVEAIADQIMIMKKGRLIAHDTPQKLLAVLDGKVKERQVSQKELEQLRRDTIICYQRASAQGTLVRYLDDTGRDACSVEPTLNDLYLYHFQEEEV